LRVTQDHGFLLAVDDDGQDGRVEGFLAQQVIQLVVVERDRLGVLVAAVDDARQLASATQAAARTSALLHALGGLEFDAHCSTPVVEGDPPATRRIGKRPGACPGPASRSMNSELTDSSLLMRSIVSASSDATETCRIFGQARASSRSGMVSVTTSSSRSDSEMRAAAEPDSTACVQ